MNVLRRLLSLVTSVLSWTLNWVSIIAVAVLVLDVLWGVATRYLLQQPSPWTEEVAQYLLMWVALLGSAVAFGRRAHLGLDYFVQKLDPAAQVVNTVLANVLVILFAAMVMVYGGWVLVRETLATGQRTPALDLPMGVVYLVVPISGMFFIIFALQQITEQISGVRQPPRTPTPPDVEPPAIRP